MINDQNGCYLYFEKYPTVEEEDPKKGKAPAKGKAPTEDLKPVYGCAWIDFTLL